MKKIAILGSTGSIGVNALDVVRRLNRSGGHFRVVSLSAHSNWALLQKQIAEFRPTTAVVGDGESAKKLIRWARGRSLKLKVRVGVDGLVDAASDPALDLVLSAVVGAVGLKPLLAALRAGKNVALANKEALVVAGELVMATARRYGGQIIPVDSEHSAMFQCLGGRPGPAAGIRRLILTASGGAFYRRKGSLSSVGVQEALNHPTWSMGPLFTINPATLVNKGLELIEAHLLFDVPFDRMDVVIHPQSVVHSMVEFVDGSTMAQASPPDMRLPISLGLSWPDRVPEAAPACDWSEAARWTFEPVDVAAFPAISLAAQVGTAGGVYPALFNAADEVAVAAFLAGGLPFPGIVDTVEQVVADYDGRFDGNELALADVLAADQWARHRAHELLQ